MSYQDVFLKDFKDWVDQQININQMAMSQSQLIFEETGDSAAKDAIIRYESRLDAYQYLQTKFRNYEEHKNFHDLPDDLMQPRHY